MSTAVYLRMSLDTTGEELGVTRQREDALALATARGWPDVALYEENGTSASGSAKRPVFERLLVDLGAGRVDRVVAWSLDRLTRNRRDTVRLIEVAQTRGATIALVRGSDLDMATPAGRLTADILAGVARHEIEQKADRQTRAARQAAELGRPPAGPVPFGYLPDRVTHHPEQAAAIKAAYEAILSGGTLAGIARTWNAAGLTSGRVRTSRVRTGEPSTWRAETVRALLLQPRNAGLRSYRGEILGRSDATPIVSDEVFYAVRAILTDPGRKTAPPTPRYLLSGVAVCSVCDEPVVAGSRRGTYTSYRCGTRGHVARRGDHVEAFVAGGTIEGVELRGLVVERLSVPDVAERVLAVDRPDTAGLRSEVTALRARLDAVAAEFAEDDTISPAQLRTMTGRLRERLAAAEAALAAAGRTSVLAPLVTADDVAAAWAEMDVDRQRAVVDTLMTIRLHPLGRGARRFDPSTIEIAWRTS